jgi:hypothetical protein
VVPATPLATGIPHYSASFRYIQLTAKEAWGGLVESNQIRPDQTFEREAGTTL